MWVIDYRFGYSSPPLVGVGTVGGVLLDQLQAQSKTLLSKYGIDLRVYGITSSRTMLLGSESKPLDLSNWREDLLKKGNDASLGVLTEHLLATDGDVDARAIVDCTASEHVPRQYLKWMQRGFHVITPNKKLNSGSMAEYQAVKQAQRQLGVHYLYEGTVGAGLPVVSTLKTLLDSGDEVCCIEGVFSGTLSFLFNSASSSKKFADIVREARQKGYTEPDPRDDLSGMDVTRKIVTLARESGSNVEIEEVNTQSLVPENLMDRSISVEAFLDALESEHLDIDMQIAQAEANGCVMRYVGRYDAETNKCEAVLKAFPGSHPFATLTGTENIISFKTRRYSDPPLTIRGPGAGAEVTAAGVLGDLLLLARYMGGQT